MNADKGSNIAGGFLLSGASGAIGTALNAALSLRRARVIQLVRREPARKEELRWDPAAPSPISNPRAIEGLDAAIHLSGSNLAARRWTEDYRREIATSRVDSTRALATLLAGLERPPRIVLIASAVGIYGDRGQELLNENSLPGAGFLAEVCHRWEASAEPAVSAGIRVVLMRFGVVLGPGAGALAQMLPVFRLGLGGKLGSGTQWMSWISIADLVAAALFAVDVRALRGPVNFVSPNPVTNAEFTRTLAQILHRPALLPAPAFALRLAFGQMADEALLASVRAVPTKLLNAGFKFSEPALPQALVSALA
jgi:uncharacterized protein (TIGR01777 family)